MSLIKDIVIITKELKRYNYVNEFYNILASSTDDASVNPDSLLFGDDNLTKEEINEVVNWFKGSKNIAKAELDARQANVDAVIFGAMHTNIIKFYILRAYALIYLDITLVRLVIISLFFHRRHDDKMAVRAYYYMLDHTDMDEEEEDNEDEEFYTGKSGDTRDKEASE